MSDEILEGQEPTETPETSAPSQPEIDPQVALDIIARQYGATPEFVDGAIRTQEENRRVDAELRRRQRELDVRDAMLRDREQSFQRPQPQQSYDDLDPVSRRILQGQEELKQRLDDRDRRERESIERASRARELEFEFDRGYEDIMRSVPTQNQVERDKFFQTMLRIYPPGPDGDLPAGVTSDMALDTTARYLGLKPNGVGYTRSQPNLRDRRASITIPAGPTSQGGQVGMIDAEPMDGETDEQRLQRLTRLARSQNMSIRNLPEGRKFSSE